MNFRILQVNFLVCAAVMACGGKPGESADSTSTSPTATEVSTGPGATTTVPGSETTAGTTGSGSVGASSSSGETATTGTPGTSTSTGPDPTTKGEETKGEETSQGETKGEGSEGTTKGESSETGTTEAVCSAQGGSCAMGEMCCGGLECCVGVPVPEGKEFCSNMCPISDRNAKTEFEPIDAAEVLRRVVSLEITTWQYKKDGPEVRHLGPMAQDFKAAFGLGDTDRMIFPLDATGVSMAAIQALQAENEALRGRLAELERRMARLER
jgi:hypothetical protein